MSYKKPTSTGDLVNDMFKTLTDFNMLKNNLLNAKTMMQFEVWFEKLELINKRALFFFIRQNKEQIPEEFLERAQRSFKQKF